MVYTHTRSYGAAQIRWRINMKMKGKPTHPNKRIIGKKPKTTKEGHQQQQGRGRRQEARGGPENSTKRHNKHNRERLSGDRVWNAFRIWWLTAHHTQTQEKEGDATRKRRTQTHPRPWQQPGPALKGKEKPRKADQQKRRRWGGGRTNPWKPEKDTKDLRQPNLPGDATDQPNPNIKTHYREGLRGINKSQPERIVFKACAIPYNQIDMFGSTKCCLHR